MYQYHLTSLNTSCSLFFVKEEIFKVQNFLQKYLTFYYFLQYRKKLLKSLWVDNVIKFGEEQRLGRATGF